MRALVFDAGPVISLTINNLLWLLEPMRDRFGGDFYLPQAVKSELVDRPIRSKKFKFEALMVLEKIDSGVLKLTADRKIKEMANRIFEIANHTLSAKGRYLNLVHQGELEALAAAIVLDADALVIDERTTRAMIEDPDSFVSLMEHRLHTRISVNKDNLKKFRNMTKGIRMIRSAEFALVAYHAGFLDRYVLKIPEARKNLLQAVLWGLKLNGCAISKNEIDQLVDSGLR
ncbi:hypothetical protein JW968_07485 [Candidatus Woesearchaeota archaeon]|nr:hypothetical protein [Candidatus Woesearchaeota archaeon]